MNPIGAPATADDAVFLPHTQRNTEATATSLSFWARSIGDRNPRFVDPSFVSAIGAGSFCAHPCWLYSVQDTIVPCGHSDLYPLIAGTDWTFHRPVMPGDKLTTVARLGHQSAFVGRLAGPSILQNVEIAFSDPHGTAFATAVSTIVLISPERARRSEKFKDWRRWKYSEDELARIESDYDREVVRGATPLYWEDVEIDDSLPGIVRGPLTSEEMVLFVGATRPIPSLGAFTHQRSKGLSADGFIHPRTGTFETYAAGLVDDESARQLGFPAAHDYGIDRISQLASLVANWMGDTGRLGRLASRLLEPNTLGDTTWFGGAIREKKDMSARLGIVRADVWGVNQRGQSTVRGSATIELPRRRQSAGRGDAVVPDPAVKA